MESPSFLISVLFLLLGAVATSVHGQGTRVGFYSATCPNAERIVRATVDKHFGTNPRIAPGILRMHFHDCFVRGCDGSVLLDGTGTEKSTFQNNGIPGYNVIDDAKAQLETACPGVVSCADILALAARDSVVVTKGISWKVPTGRRDGKVSIASEASTLPNAREPMASQLQKFKALGLNTQDLVTLVGGHTIGTTSCGLARTRLYNFNTTTGADAAIDASFVPTLRAVCPQDGNAATRVELDFGSGARFDTNFFANVRSGRGVIDSDQMLWTDPSTRAFVERFSGSVAGRGPARGLNFGAEFGKSMVKMANIGVKTDTNSTESEIRRICTAIN